MTRDRWVVRLRRTNAVWRATASTSFAFHPPRPRRDKTPLHMQQSFVRSVGAGNDAFSGCVKVSSVGSSAFELRDARDSRFHSEAHRAKGEAHPGRLDADDSIGFVAPAEEQLALESKRRFHGVSFR